MRRAFTLSLIALVLPFAGFLALSATPSAGAADTEKKATATFEIYKDKGGEHRWRLRMQNSKIIATSGEGYSSKRSCEEAIESVKKNAPDAPVEEKTDDAPARGNQ